MGNKKYYLKHRKEILKKMKKQYWENPELHRENYRKRWKVWASDPKFLEKERIRSKEKYRKHLAWYALRNIKQSKTPEQKARIKLGFAIRNGKIIRPKKCDSCNKIGKIEAHHYDGYSNPFKVMWLCKSCHVKIHHNLI